MDVLLLAPIYLSLFVHFTATVWWAATLTKRVEHIERWVAHHEHTAERLASLEQKLSNLSAGINRIERHLKKE